MTQAKHTQQDKIQEIMALVDVHAQESKKPGETSSKNAETVRNAIQSKHRELVREPMQPVVITDDGVARFKENKIVSKVLEVSSNCGGYGLNEVACDDFTQQERMQFAQLIGYSVGGYSTLSYVTDESANAAFAIAHNITNTSGVE